MCGRVQKGVLAGAARTVRLSRTVTKYFSRCFASEVGKTARKREVLGRSLKDVQRSTPGSHTT